MLGDVHGEAERDPHFAGRIAGREGVGRGQTKLVQNHIAHEGAAEVLAELGGHGQGELGVFHPFSVSGLRVAFWWPIGIFVEFALRLCRLP